MGSVLMMIFGLIALILFVVAFWYWIKSIMVMGKRNGLLGVAAFLIAPWPQIIYYFAEKQNIAPADRKTLIRSILIWVVIMVISVLATILISLMGQ